MPAILGCRSGETFDSLPRQKRGENSAIHRLQSQSSEFGITRGDSVSFAPDAAPSPGRRTSKGDVRVRNRTRSTGAALDRGISSASNGGRHSVDNGARPFLGKSRSTNSKASAKAVSSGDYPVVSSDLDQSDGGGGRHSPVKMRATRSVPGSPTKPHAEATRSGGGRQDEGVVEVQMPARKRIINKAMIGLPTNFQHTGHIGASNYSAAISDSAALQAQLSEVAAALKFDIDLGPLEPPSIGTQDSAASAKSSEEKQSTEVPAQVPFIHPAHEEELAEQPTSSQTTAPATSLDDDVLSIRAIPSAASSEAPPTLPPTQPTSSAVQRSAFAATYGHTASAPSASVGPSSGASGGLSRAGSSATAGVAAGGARKRKPVPRTLDMAFESPTAAESKRPAATDPISIASVSEETHPSDDVDLDTPLSAEPASLDRNVSLVGELPSFGGASRSRGKLTPLERAVGKAAATAPLTEADEGEEDGVDVSHAEEQGGELYTHGPNGTLRLGGKKMVEGPAGTYITDTANVRWNSALQEITMALKSDAADDAGEEEDMEAAMRRADDVLGRLGQEG